jgi:DNA-binding MarR family transcriptional regulator
MAEIMKTRMLPDVVEKKLDDADKNARRIKVSIQTDRGRSNAEFVLLFHSNLLALILYRQLTLSEIKVMLVLAEKAIYGGLLRVSGKSVADTARMARASVSRAMRRLREVGLLVRAPDGDEYLNLAVLLKGRLADLRADHREQYRLGLLALEGVPDITHPSRLWDLHEDDQG